MSIFINAEFIDFDSAERAAAMIRSVLQPTDRVEVIRPFNNGGTQLQVNPVMPMEGSVLSPTPTAVFMNGDLDIRDSDNIEPFHREECNIRVKVDDTRAAAKALHIIRNRGGFKVTSSRGK